MPSRCLLALALLVSRAPLSAQQDSYSFEKAQAFLNQYCQACHDGNSPAGGFPLLRVGTVASLQSDARQWIALSIRVKHAENAAEGSPAPSLDPRAVPAVGRQRLGTKGFRTAQ